MWFKTFLSIFVMVLTSTASAQNAERTSLLLGGYPVFDANQSLTQDQRDQVVEAVKELEVTAGLQLVLVLQNQSLSGDAAQDLSILRDQLRRSELWTARTVMLLVQAQPKVALVARPPELRAQTAPITPSALQDLEQAAASEFLHPQLMKILSGLAQVQIDQQRVEAAQAARWAIGGELRALLAHAGILFFMALIVALILPGRPLPTVMGGKASLGQPLAAFSFPRGVFSAARTQSLRGGCDVRLIRQAGASRHRGLIFGLALGCATLSLIMLESLRLIDWGWMTSTWYYRAALTGLVFIGLLALLLSTRLGAWLTPAAWRRRLLITRVHPHTQAARPAILLLYQVHRRKIEAWATADIPFDTALLTQPLVRLKQDAEHGLAAEGLKTFIDQAERLGLTYASGRLDGQVQVLKL